MRTHDTHAAPTGLFWSARRAVRLRSASSSQQVSFAWKFAFGIRFCRVLSAHGWYARSQLTTAISKMRTMAPRHGYIYKVNALSPRAWYQPHLVVVRRQRWWIYHARMPPFNSVRAVAELRMYTHIHMYNGDLHSIWHGITGNYNEELRSSLMMRTDAVIFRRDDETIQRWGRDVVAWLITMRRGFRTESRRLSKSSLLLHIIFLGEQAINDVRLKGSCVKWCRYNFRDDETKTISAWTTEISDRSGSFTSPG